MTDEPFFKDQYVYEKDAGRIRKFMVLMVGHINNDLMFVMVHLSPAGWCGSEGEGFGVCDYRLSEDEEYRNLHTADQLRAIIEAEGFRRVETGRLKIVPRDAARSSEETT